MPLKRPKQVFSAKNTAESIDILKPIRKCCKCGRKNELDVYQDKCIKCLLLEDFRKSICQY